MGRLEKIAAMVKEKGFDAVLITGQENLQYATEFPHLEGFAVITADGQGFCYTDSRYIEAAHALMDPQGYTVIEPQGSYSTFSTPQEVIDKCGIKTLAFEDLLMPVHDYKKYCEALSAELVPVGNAFEILREIKDEKEIESLVKAQRIAEDALTQRLPPINARADYDELAAELEYPMKGFRSRQLQHHLPFGRAHISAPRHTGTQADRKRRFCHYRFRGEIRRIRL